MMRLDKHSQCDEERLRQDDGSIICEVVEMMYGDAEPPSEVWKRIHQSIIQPPPTRFSREWWLRRVSTIRFMPALQLSLACGLMLLVLSYHMLGGTGDAIFAQEEPVVPESPAVSQVVSEDETTQIDDVFFLSYPSALAQRKLTPYRDMLKYTATTVSTGLPIRDPVDEHRRQWFESLRQEQVYNDKLADYIRLHLPQ